MCYEYINTWRKQMACWCERFLPFQRPWEGSCPQITHSVGSWSEKSKSKRGQATVMLQFKVVTGASSLMFYLFLPGLCRKLLSLPHWNSDPPSAWCKHKLAHPAAHLSLQPPESTGRKSYSLYRTLQLINAYSQRLLIACNNQNSIFKLYTHTETLLSTHMLPPSGLILPALPLLWDACREIALSQLDRCSLLLEWSYPLCVLQWSSIPDCSDWLCHCTDNNYTSHTALYSTIVYLGTYVKLHLTQSCTSGLGRSPLWFSLAHPSTHASHSCLWSAAHLRPQEGQSPQ